MKLGPEACTVLWQKKQSTADGRRRNIVDMVVLGGVVVAVVDGEIDELNNALVGPVSSCNFISRVHV